jgi:hypothetical protein
MIAPTVGCAQVISQSLIVINFLDRGRMVQETVVEAMPSVFDKLGINETLQFSIKRDIQDLSHVLWRDTIESDNKRLESIFYALLTVPLVCIRLEDKAYYVIAR